MIIPLAASVLLALTPAKICPFGGEAEAWTRVALEAWDRLDHERIHMTNPSTPGLVLFDDSCVYRFTPRAEGAFEAGGRVYAVRSDSHSGEIALPDGETIPARKLSFAAPTADGSMYFVMALPSVWRADIRETRDPEHLAMLVFMHEFAHTQQGSGLGRKIDALITRGLPGDADDDSIQKAWEGNPAYVAAYREELDLLYRAAGAPDKESRRALLAEAADRIHIRRERFLGDQPLWREADDLFLTFEGSGNWAAWAWLTDARGGGMTAEQATTLVRGSKRWWSQDAGLGLMLTLDGLTPDWPSLTFGPNGVTADDLIARALQPSRSSE
jgi:hypothetical protein